MTSGDQPLAGRRILLPARTTPTWRLALESAGAVVDEVTLLRRVPRPGADVDQLPARIRRGDIDWVVVTSPFTVEAFDRLGLPMGRILAPSVKVAAVGPTTAAAVQGAVGHVDLVPESGTGSDALVACFPVGEGRVLVPGAAVTADVLPAALGRLGWAVERLALYETFPVAQVPEPIGARWRSGGYDMLVATSGSAARAVAGLLGTGVPVVVLGRMGERVARRAGFATVARAEAATAADVVSAAAEVLAGGQH